VPPTICATVTATPLDCAAAPVGRFVDPVGPFVDLDVTARAEVLRRAVFVLRGAVFVVAVFTALFRGVAFRGFRAAFALFFPLRAIRFCFATLYPPPGTKLSAR